MSDKPTATHDASRCDEYCEFDLDHAPHCSVCPFRPVQIKVGTTIYDRTAEDWQRLHRQDVLAKMTARTASESEAPFEAWLIERGSPAEYWVKGSGKGDGTMLHEEWTTDAYKAQRFNEWGAKWHAKELESWGVKGPLRACGHMFNCGTSPLSAGEAPSMDRAVRDAYRSALTYAASICDAKVFDRENAFDNGCWSCGEAIRQELNAINRDNPGELPRSSAAETKPRNVDDIIALIKDAVDYHDISDAEADAMDVPASAAYHAQQAKALRMLLEPSAPVSATAFSHEERANADVLASKPFDAWDGRDKLFIINLALRLTNGTATGAKEKS